jgi:hypothetical protein
MQYGEFIRATMLDNGLPVSPLTRHGDHSALRFDSVEVLEDRVTFLWLGKPVSMVRRHQGAPTPVRGEMSLNLN